MGTPSDFFAADATASQSTSTPVRGGEVSNASSPAQDLSRQSRHVNYDGDGISADSLPDKVKFEEFFRSQYLSIVTSLMRAGFDSETARDATSDAMMYAYTNWAHIAFPVAWVRTVALRSAARSEWQSRRLLPLSSDIAEELAGPPDEYGLNGRELFSSLKTLPWRQRQIVFLLSAGLTSTEIGEQLNITSAAVRSHLRHARHTLRRRLKNVNAERRSTGHQR